jgi:hypothetical protein
MFSVNRIKYVIVQRHNIHNNNKYNKINNIHNNKYIIDMRLFNSNATRTLIATSHKRHNIQM